MYDDENIGSGFLRSLRRKHALLSFGRPGTGEGSTLVVETAGFNDKTPLDDMGHSHSEALRVLERLRRLFGDLDYEITLDDPKMNTVLVR